MPRRRREKSKHPMQPVVVARDGVVRFLENKAVHWLLTELEKSEPYVQNRMHLEIVAAGEVDDYQHLMQLIGYSVNGYGDLDCHDRDVFASADAEAAKLTGN